MVCFLLTAFYAENAIGSPSSTSALILIFIPIYAVISAIGGGVFGLILSLILRPLISFVSLGKTITMGIVLTLGLSLLASAFSSTLVKSHVKLNEPGVKYSNSSLIKQAIDKKLIIPENKVIPFARRDKGAEILWNDTKIRLSYSANEIIAIDTNNTMIIQTSVSGFDYIRELQAREIKLSLSEKKYLVILADLRATSHHAILIVYSPSGSIIHQEMFDIRGHELVMGINKLASDQEDLILDSKDGFFLYSLKQ